ncbi:hypothetical protein ABIB35_001924 [Arthrobacter sp. UYP6]
MIPPSKPSDTQCRPESAESGPETRPESGPGGPDSVVDERPGSESAGSEIAQNAVKSQLKFRWLQDNEIPVDLIRRSAVSVAAAAAAGITIVQSRADGAFVDRGSDAILGSAGSLLAPSALMWWLWVPAMAGWLGYALYQWLPRQRSNPRHERFGWLILASQILAFAWLLTVASGSSGVLLAVAAAQITVGLVAVHSMNLRPPSSSMEGILTDVPLGLSLAAGVLSLVTIIGFLLTRSEADLAGWGGTVWALVGLITVMVGTTMICMTDRGHLSVALAIVWGLCCVAVERLTGAPDSIGIGVGAAVAAFLVLVSAGSRRHQVDHERRRNERRNGGRSQPDPAELASA